MIDPTDWRYGIARIKESIEERDVDGVNNCMNIMDSDIQETAKTKGIDTDKFWSASSFVDFYMLKDRPTFNPQDYDDTINAVMDDLANLSNFVIVKTQVKQKKDRSRGGKTKGKNRAVPLLERNAKIQSDAEKIWRTNPNLSKPDIAKKLVEKYENDMEETLSISTIRQIITKPKKK